LSFCVRRHRIIIESREEKRREEKRREEKRREEKRRKIGEVTIIPSNNDNSDFFADFVIVLFLFSEILANITIKITIIIRQNPQKRKEIVTPF
jgi:hypothetical protein